MLPLLVTWVPGTNVTHYNRYPTSSRLLHVTVLQYKSKILACYKAQIAHFGGEFSKKCYKVPVKSVTRGGYTQLLLLHLLLRGGRGGSPVLPLQSVTNWGGAKKLALQSVTKGGVTALSEGYVIYGRSLTTVCKNIPICLRCLWRSQT